MPAAAPPIKRYPQAPFPLTNGTIGASPTPFTTITTSQNVAAGTKPPAASSAEQTPSSVPSMSLARVNVAPVGQIPDARIDTTPVPTYAGSTANILQGHCTEPNYTILDGPTALWVPVVGCISSKSDCCPTPMPTAAAGASEPSASGAAGDGGNKPNGVSGGKRGAFPISALPDQGKIQGCPKDYHTVTASEGTACCPSSYWLWSTQLGGQVPCYSSLNKALVPPPMPDTLAYADRTTTGGSVNSQTGGSITPAPSSNRGGILGQEKPTSAVVNIAYAMQYPLAEENKSGLKGPAKIGVGVGAAVGGLLVLVIIAFLVKRCLSKKKAKVGGYVDESRAVAHEPMGVTVVKTHDGVKYSGVPSSAVHG